MKYTLTIILISLLAGSLFVKNAAAVSDNNEFVVSESIIDAVESIDIVSLNVLLAEGADVNVADDHGNTPLMLASEIGNPRMVKIILAHQPEINRKNSEGFTALMIASMNGQIHIVDQLLAKGASVNETNNAGLSATDLAVRFGQPAVAALLRNSSGQIYTR